VTDKNFACAIGCPRRGTPACRATAAPALGNRGRVHDPCPCPGHRQPPMTACPGHKHHCAGGTYGGTSRITSHETLYKSIGYEWYSIPAMDIELRLFVHNSAQAIVDLFECGLLTGQQCAQLIRIEFGYRLVVGGLLDDCLTRGGDASYIQNI
jgi:hypothetical protein